MRIAAVQHDIVWEDRDANFARLAPQVARAVGAGAELVLLTETFSTGFSMTPGIGEPEGGPSSRFLAAQAAEHGVWVAGTCPEIGEGSGGAAGEQELPYNSFVLAGPDGTMHRYRKLHPFTHAGEHERFRAGEKPVENVSVRRTSSAPVPTAPAMRGARRSKLASRSSQTMSCCTAAILMPASSRRPSEPCQPEPCHPSFLSRVTASASTSSRLQNAKRTRCRPRCACAGS